LVANAFGRSTELVFGVSESLTSQVITHGLEVLADVLGYEISWPDPVLQGQLQGTFGRYFPNVIGAIDASSLEIRRPWNTNERDYFRGDKPYHAMIVQAIV
jgi:hypothetical protein